MSRYYVMVTASLLLVFKVCAALQNLLAKCLCSCNSFSKHYISFDVSTGLQAPPTLLTEDVNEIDCHHKTGCRGYCYRPVSIKTRYVTVCLTLDFTPSKSRAFGVACVGSEARLCNAHHPLNSCRLLVFCYSGRSL